MLLVMSGLVYADGCSLRGHLIDVAAFDPYVLNARLIVSRRHGRGRGCDNLLGRGDNNLLGLGDDDLLGWRDYDRLDDGSRFHNNRLRVGGIVYRLG